jgi:uncharacterized protein (TIGR00725 family)
MAQRIARLGVIGSARCSAAAYRLAEQVGEGIARQGAILVCGGLGGVMEAACKGAKAGGGMTIGILPGVDPDDANAFVDVPLPTGLSLARNVLVVRSSDALIAIEGGYGTLSEIAFSLQLGTPVIGLRTTYTDPRLTQARDAREAVELASAAAASRTNRRWSRREDRRVTAKESTHGDR